MGIENVRGKAKKGMKKSRSISEKGGLQGETWRWEGHEAFRGSKVQHAGPDSSYHGNDKNGRKGIDRIFFLLSYSFLKGASSPAVELGAGC